jgi:nucleotide-binding universal stress UspA family protein
MSRNICVCIDSSSESRDAAIWLVENFARQGDIINLISVTNPPSAVGASGGFIGIPVAPQITAYHTAVKEEEAFKEKLITDTYNFLLPKISNGIKMHAHLLPPCGGASSVADSITTYAEQENCDVVVLSSRGMGAVKSALMSALGLGSVSSYCLHHLKNQAVIIVKGQHHPQQQPTPPPARNILVAIDDLSSPSSRCALQWALDNAIISPSTDHLRIATVIPANPYVVEDSDAVAAHGLEMAELDAFKTHTTKVAQSTAEEAVKVAKSDKIGIHKNNVSYRVLLPEGGASGVGATLVSHAKQTNATMVVVGGRSLGAMKRMGLSLIGLGSVSDYVVNNVGNCPVVVVHHASE